MSKILAFNTPFHATRSRKTKVLAHKCLTGDFRGVTLYTFEGAVAPPKLNYAPSMFMLHPQCVIPLLALRIIKYAKFFVSNTEQEYSM